MTVPLPRTSVAMKGTHINSFSKLNKDELEAGSRPGNYVRFNGIPFGPVLFKSKIVGL